MENFINFLAALFSAAATDAAPQNYPIGNSGGSITLRRPPSVHKFRDNDGNHTWIGHTRDGKVSYGYATVVWRRPFECAAAAEQALYLFLEDMHQSFDIVCTTGLEYGFRHPSQPELLGMTDYWQDACGHDYKVRGWTDGEVLSVLYVKNIGAADYKEADAYLNSFSLLPVGKLV